MSNNSWSETGITYNNAPAIGAPLGSSGSCPGNAYVSVDVTPLVQGSGLGGLTRRRSCRAAGWAA